MHSSEQGRQSTGWSGGGRRAAIAVIGAGVLALSAAALASGSSGKGYGGGNSLGAYKTHNLVSDQAGKADIRDSMLVNAWGLAIGPNRPAWVADNGTDVSTLYTGDVGGAPVDKFPLTVKI